MDATSSSWSWRLFRSSAAGAAALLLAAGAIAAAPQGTAQTPQFRAGVDLVEVDVTVIDRDGRPVTTLTRADFEVRERGDVQRIDTIFLVTADPALLGRTGGRGAPEAAPAATPVTPVRPLGPRVFVFVFDMAHLSANGLTRGRTAIRSFLADGLRPGDLAGIVVDGTMLGNRIVSDKAVLQAQLDGLTPPNLSRFNERRQWPRILSEEEAVAIARNNTAAREAAVMRACEERPGDCEKGGRMAVEAEIDGKSRLIAGEALRDGQTALAALQALANGLGRFPGPKHVVFLSEGFYTGEFAERVTQVSGLAARNRVRISTLDARGLNTDPRQQDLFGAAPVQSTGDLAVLGADADADVLTTLALDTGGQRVRNRNNLRPALDSIAAETGTFYILGYSPSTPFDGAYRPISVRVLRPGLTVRARRGYLATRIENTPLQSANDNRQTAIDNRQTANDNRVSPPAASGLPPAASANPPGATLPVAPPAGPPSAAGAPVDPVGALRLRPDAALGRNVGAVSDHLAAPAGPGPDRAARLAREGWDLYSKGDVEGARDRLAAAAEAGGGAWVQYALGLSEFTLRHVDAARIAFESVRKAEPEFKGVYFDLADAYLQLGRVGDALAVLRDAARRWPEDAETHNAVGVVLVKRGALDDAIEAFQHATSAAPAEGLGYYNLGRALHMRYLRWLQTTPSTPSTRAMADRSRTSALEAYRKSVALGGSFEKEAKEAIAVLEWK